MKRQVLEIDKMQHLKELGVATSNASFYWSYNGHRLNIVSEHGNLKAFEQRNLGIGAFDVQDIIELIPPRLKEKYVFHIHKIGDHYHLEYSYPGCDATLHTSYSHNLLDAAYDMYIWYLTRYKKSNL